MVTLEKEELKDKLGEEAGWHFDKVSNCIINTDFAIKEMPDKQRRARNIRFYCHKGG